MKFNSNLDNVELGKDVIIKDKQGNIISGVFILKLVKSGLIPGSREFKNEEFKLFFVNDDYDIDISIKDIDGWCESKN